MSYAYECPLCKKIIRAIQIPLHLIDVHNYKFRTFEEKVVSEGILVKIYKDTWSAEHDNPEDALLFKKIKIKKGITKYLGYRMYKTFDELVKESDK